MNLISILKQILQEEKSKRDRCLRIADRKFDKPSAYKSGAVVRCRKGKIWKGIKEGEEQLNVQDLAYKQIPGLLEKGIERELEFLSDIMDETLEDTKNLTNPEIKRVPLKFIKPSQHGEDYKTPSSESEAEEFRKILNGEKNVEDHREGDLHPILVNRITNKIIDGNHRHYALLAANSPYAVVLYVDVPRGYLNERKSKIQYKKPNFEFEWNEAIRYPEFKQMGEEGWINLAKKGYTTKYSQIEDILGNVDLNFNTLEADKKKRFQQAFETGTIELPIAVKFDENNYDLVAGNTRLAGLVDKGIDPLIWIVDLTSEILTEKQKETLRTWFKRKGAPGKTGGWVDCNSPIRKDGKITGYKPCGRQKGETRSKYPSCRPTPSKCKDPGKGKKWGKTK